MPTFKNLGPVEEEKPKFRSLGPVDQPEDKEKESFAKKAVKNVAGMAGASADFIGAGAGLVGSAIAAPIVGAYGALTGKGTFLDEYSDTARKIQESIHPAETIDKALGTEFTKTPSYEAATTLFGLPAEYGVKALRGYGGIAESIRAGDLEAGAEHVLNPEQMPALSAFEDAAGTLGGYALTGKLIGKAKGGGYTRPMSEKAIEKKRDELGYGKEEAPQKTFKNLGPIEYKKPELALVPEEQRPAPPPEQPGVIVDGEMARLQPEMAEARPEVQPMPPRPPMEEAGIDYGLPENPKYPTQFPEETQQGFVLNPAQDAMASRLRQQQMEENARAEYTPTNNAPMDYGMSLEPREQVGAREFERDAIYEMHKDFPTEDIQLKLEKAEKDTHLKGLVTKLQNLERTIREKELEAGKEATQDTRILGNQKGTRIDQTKAGKERSAEADNLIEKDRIKRDNMKAQVAARLKNRHPNIELKENIDTDGVRNYSLYEKVNPELETFAKTTSDKVNYTRDKLLTELEKTEPPNMQRSLEVPEQPRPVRHTFTPKGQRGVIHPDLLVPGFIRNWIERLQQGKTGPYSVGDSILDKFKGTYKEYVIEDLKAKASEPNSNVNVVMLSPAEFLQMAARRPDEMMKGDIPEQKRSRIRKGLAGKEGLNEIPFLVVTRGSHPKEYQTVGHEGRHRADELQAAGVELMPVIIEHGYEKDAGLKFGKDPTRTILRGEQNNGVNTLPVPQPLYKKQEISTFNRRMGSKQYGAVDPSVFGEGLSKLLGRAKTAEQLRAELGYDKPEPTGSPRQRDALKEVLPVEHRTLEQFVEDEIKNAGSFKDIPNTLLNKVIQPNSVGALSQKYNPFVRYMSSKLDTIDRNIRVEKENALWGKGFKMGVRGWSKRIKSEDGARTILDSLKKNDADGVRSTIVNYMDGKVLQEMGLERPSEEMLRSDGLTNQQIKSVNAIYNQMDGIWDKVNTLAEKLGIAPIAKRPGYFPSLWEGDYRIFVKNEDGKVVSAFGAKNKWQMEKIAEDLRKKHPEFDVSVADASQSRYKMNDTNAFRLALDFLDPNSPEAKLLEKTYKDIVAHRGFKTHGLMKEGAGGFLGSESGVKGIKDFEKAMDIYFDKAYDFIGELEKKNALAEMKNKFAEQEYSIPTKLENTNEYLNEMTANSTGSIKNQMEFINHILEGTGGRLGVGASAAQRGIKNLSGLAGVAWLSTVKFLEVQMFQPAYNLAKLSEMKGKLDTGSAMKHMMNGYMEAFVKPSVETKEAMSWAKQNGFIDAKILDLMGVNLNKGIWAKKIMNEVPKHTLGWWEQEVVRTPTFLAYNSALKNVVKDKKERWEQAGALTDKYMVNYSRTQSPSVYSSLGIVGDAARPLKQYTHAYAGQLAEYTAIAAHDKKYQPLATFLGVQWALAGVKGLVPITMAAMAIQALNKYAYTDLPTPEELMLGSGMSDLMTFGPASIITGQDLSGSLSAPDPSQMGALPGIDYASNIGGAATSFAAKAAQGLDTEADKMKLAQAAVPSQFQGQVEQAFTQPGQGVPNPNNRMIPDLGPRSPQDQMLRNITGARPIDEASQKLGIRAMKTSGQRLKEQKKLIMDKVLNDVIQGKEIPEELPDEWMKIGGDVREWGPAIKQHIIDTNLTYAERELSKLKGISGAEKAQRLEKFRVGIEKLNADDLAEVTRELHE